MANCSTCGNDYPMAFTLRTHAGEEYVFDSFECAIEKVAPRCSHCGCRIIGHGVEGPSSQYCCAHCARQSGQTEAVDNTAH